MYAWARIETEENTCQVGGEKKKRRQLVKGKLFFGVPSATKNALNMKMN